LRKKASAPALGFKRVCDDLGDYLVVFGVEDGEGHL
jgi:hypothetical protein